MRADFQNIPDELRAPALWLQYYLSPDPKHPDKKPRKHPCVKYATPEDRKANLRPLDKLLERPATTGVQRWIDKAEGFTYIDIDRVRKPESDEIEAWALELIHELDTYCEISASGTGLHLIARAMLPRDFHVDPNQVEIYAGNTTNKLLALTGDIYKSYGTIHARQDSVTALLNWLETQACNKETPVAAEVQRPQLPVVDEPEISVQEELLPEFPRLTGQLGDLVDAITADLPYEHKALSTLTYIGLKLSGRARLASEPYLQPRFYACMVGPPGTGKSSSEKEVRRALQGDVLESVHCELSLDSGPALVEALAENPRIVYSPDEMADAFEKAKQTATGRNSLFGEFLRLYESNETARRVVKKNAEAIELNNVHLAMIGSATPERFDRMWAGTAGASGGLQSRFVLSFSEKPLPIIKNPSDEQAISLAVSGLADTLNTEQPVIRLSSDAQDSIQDWAVFKDLRGAPRVLDMAKRFVLVLAACNRETEVDGESMRRALAFADYQIAVHDRLMPRDSAGWVQAFENRVITFFERHQRATERQVRNVIKPERYPGGYGAFQQACRNLVGTGKLKQAGKTRKSAPIWELDV